MKILYIHQHFITNQGTGGTRSYDIARHMVSLGHEVTVICGDFWQAHWPPLPDWKPYEVREVAGVKVIRCNVVYSNKMEPNSRVLAFFKFAFLATLMGLFERGVDLVFATSTPLTVGIPGRLVSTFRGLPYVFEVRDLWPEDFVGGGYMKVGSFKWRLFDILEKFSYATAARITTVSKGFSLRLIERGFKESRIATHLLGADGALFEDLEVNEDFFTSHDLNDKITAVYCGSMGVENGLDLVIDAAVLLRDEPDIVILLIGDGMTLPALKAQVQEQGLTNVRFISAIPKSELFSVLKGCDIGLLPLRNQHRDRFVTPNKYFDYIFVGLPVVVNFSGTMVDLIDEHGFGLAASPGDTQALADHILTLARDSKTRQAMGQRGRELALANYDRKRIASEMIDMFREVQEERKV